MYFPSPVKRVLVEDLLRKEGTVDLTFLFLPEVAKRCRFLRYYYFALFDSYAFLDCSTNFVGHDGTHRNRTRCKLFCFIIEDMLSSVKCFCGSQFCNWLEYWRRSFFHLHYFAIIFPAFSTLNQLFFKKSE